MIDSDFGSCVRWTKALKGTALLRDLLVVMLGELDPLEVPAETRLLRGGVKIPEEGVKSTDSVVVFEFVEADVEAAEVVAVPVPEAWM